MNDVKLLYGLLQINNIKKQLKQHCVGFLFSHLELYETSFNIKTSFQQKRIHHEETHKHQFSIPLQYHVISAQLDPQCFHNTFSGVIFCFRNDDATVLALALSQKSQKIFRRLVSRYSSFLKHRVAEFFSKNRKFNTTILS